MGNQKTKFSLVSSLFVLLPMVAIGILFTISYLSNDTTQTTRLGVDLPSLARNKEATVEALQAEVTAAKNQVELLTKQAKVPTSDAVTQPHGYRGPGISVALTDAPYTDKLPDGASADDLVIHQGDIEAVFNALWAGGADSVAIGGLEVRPNTLVRCVGNVININGKLHSPPFVISAIGDPQNLKQAIANDEAIQIFQQYVNRYHLGFHVEESSDIVITRVKTLTDYKYVRVLKDGSTSR
ncbi:DUF881 domain-containing protein [Gleimia sp. 6138-11-ORH1]|uniref:DUF881 domain-containing protein n=1 Tax=Gleimia sp. 6138-11-ORH1 TaxID=2973937 RepID=UPI002167F438|nr:DUF881 domain-containing protein [Gleimia sp. 6138-11-ORH1]MCS4485114.1 DUF881 domain-containing protein [Gleimia sp. 6138-11-ORH1]